MADHTVIVAKRELIIDADPSYGWVQYIGSRADLEDEGLIPENFDWPRAAADRCWQANGFDYWLRRARPTGHKGPMRSWLEMDNWFIRVNVTGRDYHWHTRRALERKTEELRAEYYHHTAEGSREWSANWNRYCKAHEDKAFQAFKAIFIPERKKPGRKPKETDRLETTAGSKPANS